MCMSSNKYGVGDILERECPEFRLSGTTKGRGLTLEDAQLQLFY